MTLTDARRAFRAARKRYLTCALGDKRRSLDALRNARTALMIAENAAAATTRASRAREAGR
jgi:hypothetical protein